MRRAEDRSAVERLAAMGDRFNIAIALAALSGGLVVFVLERI